MAHRISRNPPSKTDAAAITPTTFGALAAKLSAKGYQVIPIDAIDRKKPEPAVGDWRSYHFVEADAQRYAKDGIGIRCGKVRAVDVDIRTRTISIEIEALAIKMLGAAPRRIGLAPKTLLLYRTAESGPKITGTSWRFAGDQKGDKPHRIEVLGDGQQFVAYGIHRDTKQPYVWNGAGDPLNIAAIALPLVTDARLREFVAAADEVLAQYGRRIGRPGKPTINFRRPRANLIASSFKDLLSAFAALPNETDYEAWYQTGLAFYRGCGRHAESEEAAAAWLEWCAKHANDDPKESTRKWQSFAKAETPENPLGAGSIFQRAKNAGWKRGTQKDSGPAPDISNFTPPTAADVATLQIAPKRALIEGLIYPGAQLVVGRSKIGKSWLLLQLAFAVAEGASFLDYACPRAGEVLYISAEDDDARLKQRMAIMGFARPPKNLHMVNENLLRETAEKFAPHMSLLEFLDEYVAKHSDTVLICLDTEVTVLQIWREYFEGDDRRGPQRITEQDYKQAREFDELAKRYGLVITLTNHTGKRRGETLDVHELINTTAVKTAGASGSIVLAELPRSDPLDPTERRRLLAVRGRDLVDEVMLVIEHSRENARFDVLGTYAEFRQTDAEDEILQAVTELQGDGEEYISSREIAEHLGVRRGAVKRAISRMVRAGRLRWRNRNVEVRNGVGIRLMRR